MPRARCLPSSLCCLPRIRGHASSPLLFFLLSTRFATSLTFVFRSFSPAFRLAEPSPASSRAFQPRRPAALQQHPRPAPRREHRGTRAEDLSPSTRIPAAVLKQALYDSKGTSPRSTRLLPSSRRRTSAPSPTRTSSNLDHRAFSDGHHGTKRLLLRGDVPSAGGVSKCAARP